VKTIKLNKQKKGWIRIVEAFMAIVLLLGFVFVILIQVNPFSKGTSLLKTNNIKILKVIETNFSLRNLVLASSPPINSNETNFPSELNESLIKNTLSGETCFLYICSVESECNLNEDIQKEVYSSEILIFSNETLYSPRKLKVFCYDA